MLSILKISKQKVTIMVVLTVVIIGISFGAYQAYLYINSTQKEINEIRNDFVEMKNLFEQLADNNTLLQEALENEKHNSKLIKNIVEDLSSDVDIFKKLSELDSELLKKYSKVYFLSENYAPSNLDYIDKDFIYKEEEKVQLHTNVLPFLHDMLQDAERDNVELFIISGYRSFGEQSALKGNYVIRYGAETANGFSAEQGYSEHQLGTTIDFTTKGLNGKLDGFQNTPDYKWLIDNAYKYGFVLSYPQNNNYYVFEPWHWRFVGKKLAKLLDEENIYLYDVPQREIDEYLINIFEK